MSLVLGGFGLRSVARVSVPAHWASWADCLPISPALGSHIASSSSWRHPVTPFLSSASPSVGVLRGTMGFNPPTWQSLCEGARPEILEPDEFETGIDRGGWQHEASSRVELQTPQARALVRSQSGPGGSVALTTAPTSVLTKIPPHLFRVVLRRLCLPLALSQHAVWPSHRSVRPPVSHRMRWAGALGRRGFALESAAAQVCWEGGGRVTTNVMVRDLDLPVPDASDGRRLEVVVDGLPLFGGFPVGSGHDICVRSPQ